MRRRIRTKKPFISYVLPLFLSLGVIILGVLLVNVILSFFASNEQQNRLAQPLAEFQVSSPNVYLLLNNKPSKLNEGWNNIKLSHLEGIMTGSQGKVELQLDRDQEVRLDEFTSLLGSWTDGKKFFGVEKGSIWYAGDGNITPQAIIKTPLIDVDPLGATTFSMTVTEDLHQIAVFSGSADVIVWNKDGKQMEKKILNSGEQMDVVKDEAGETTFKVIPSTLYDTPWVKSNREQVADGQNNVNENDNGNNNENQNANTSSKEMENANTNSSQALSRPVLTSTLPANKATIPPYIEGSLSKDIVKVQVNEFVLQRFVPGSGTWRYNLIDGYNVKAGNNTFRVVGYTEDGKATPPLTVTVTYEPKTSSTNTNSTATNSNTNTSTARGNGTGTGAGLSTED